MHLYECHVLVLIRGDYFRRHLSLDGEPAGQFAFLKLTGFGEGQAVGIDDRAERHCAAVYVELHYGIARRLGYRGKRAQRFLPVSIAVQRERGLAG